MVGCWRRRQARFVPALRFQHLLTGLRRFRDGIGCVPGARPDGNRKSPPSKTRPTRLPQCRRPRRIPVLRAPIGERGKRPAGLSRNRPAASGRSPQAAQIVRVLVVGDECRDTFRSSAPSTRSIRRARTVSVCGAISFHSLRSRREPARADAEPLRVIDTACVSARLEALRIRPVGPHLVGHLRDVVFAANGVAGTFDEYQCGGHAGRP